MIRTARARIAAVAGAGVLAACTGVELPPPIVDPAPCAGVATCVVLDVNSLVIKTIDQLELDVVYAGHHATVTTGTVGKTIDLPSSLPLRLDLPDPPLIQVDLIAAGKLGGSVLGLGASSTTVQQGHQATAGFLLEPAAPCVEGALYCGGTTSGASADVDALYRCTGGVPIFYARCSSGCTRFLQPDAVCFGGGLCRDGGIYCGGDLLDGDPGTLYVCHSFVGTNPQPCPAGCVVRGDGNDTCR